MQQNKNDSLDEEDSITSESSDINNSKEDIIYKSDEASIIIEKILISIYNKNIKSDNSEKDDLDINLCQNNIRNLCLKYDYCYIVLLLLKNIRKLINKYREIIFDHTDVNYKYRSYSPNNKKVNIPKYKNYFQIDSNNNHKSYPKYKEKLKEEDSNIKTLFIELYNIKRCLKKSSPIIEKIFEIPLTNFEHFSLEKCQLEEYINILIRDKYISNKIKKNKDSKLINVLHELTEGSESETKLMTTKLEVFNIMYKSKLKFKRLLTIADIGSSVDEKYPEDCEPIGEIRYNNINNFINAEDINGNYFLADEGEDFNLDFDIIKDNNFPNINMINFSNNINNLDEEDEINEKDEDKTREIINKITKKSFNDTEIKMETIIKSKKVNSINNINEEETTELLEKSNLFIKKNKSYNKEHLDNNFNFNGKHNITNLIAQNKNSDNWKTKKCYPGILNNEKLVRDKEPILFKNIKNSNNKNKKENANKFANNNKNFKIDKKEIPSDIDDLVKYIVTDDKKESQIKKKKKNKKKTKKKNKNEVEINKDKDETNINIEEIKEKEKEKDEDDEIIQNLISNSINRFKIHKIKFKYRPKWLEKISKYS